MSNVAETLAIHGGRPVREKPMPNRLAISGDERAMIEECLAYYGERGVDPGYQDVFERRYTDYFVDMMGGGYADAVATGTAAVFVALAALRLPEGSQVLCSPITDPGTLSAITLNRLVPRLIDSEPGSYNAGPAQFAARICPEVTAAVIVHSAGQACDIPAIMEIARNHGIKVVEDCSQAHLARHNGRPVGTFGDIAAFSTMYRKASISGGSGGIVYSRDRELYHQALAHADRGKPVWQDGFDWRDPRQFLFPALNLHTDEISCAIGLASVKRLPQTIMKRLAFVAEVSGELRKHARLCRAPRFNPNDSPFISPIFVDLPGSPERKVAFAQALIAEGIPLNPHYQYVAATWPFLAEHLSDNFSCPNAREAVDNSFCLYVNENYGVEEAKDVIKAVMKVEAHFCSTGS